jgi:hypothetical protein
MTVSSGSNAPSSDEITDSDARRVLEVMCQKVTDEAIRTLRDQLANVQQSMKSVKSSYFIEIQRDIKTNDLMLPADFRQ